MERLIRFLEDKNILVLGYGREGKTTCQWIQKHLPGKEITVADLRPQQLEGENIRGVFGEGYQKTLLDYDLIIKSPGIVLENKSKEVISRVTSQTELFLSLFRNQVIGITGTKGKSTTSALTAHIFKESGFDTLLLGNIGIPAFSKMDEIHEDTVIVYELSCHQLEYTRVSPHIGVLLNLYEEHLDHYGTFENYKNAKANLYRNQKEGDYLFCFEECLPKKNETRATVIPFGPHGILQIEEDEVSYRRTTLMIGEAETHLKGRHNLNNIGVAYALAKEYGISDEDFLKGLSTFAPLPHRLQEIGTFDGVTYYDDSISTIGQTAIQAVEALKAVGSILIGGMERGIDYSDLEEFFFESDVPVWIFLPDSGYRIAEELKKKRDLPSGKEIYLAKDLKDGVAIAKEKTPKGTICLLSPAAASYGFFKDFEQRGDAFARYVRGEE